MDPTPPSAPPQRKPRVRPQLTIELCVRPQGQSPGIIRLTVGKEQADYNLTELPADIGRGFVVVKIGQHAEDKAPGKYAVTIDGDKTTCDCKGHTHHGHCKHADSIAALIASGEL